jgi:arabinogalactan oligomer/maltooligosaccharide transport system substrate-binding protein
MLFVSRVCVLLLILSLAACNPSPAVPTPIPVVPRPTAAPTAAPRPTAAPAITRVAQPVAPPSALVLWAVVDDARVGALRRLIADLSTSVGTDVVVIQKSADGLLADIRADALAGLPPPDLIWGTQDELGLLQRDDMLRPAAEGLAEDAILPAIVAGGTVQGRRWGTPLAAQGYLLLLYNRKLATSPPRTTDELIARARALMHGDTYGLVAAWAEPRWFSAWLHGFGGAALTADGRPSLDTPQTIAALDLLKELRTAGPPPPSTYVEGVELFRAGHAAFAIDGDWSLAGYRDYTDTLDLGIAPLPIVPATQKVAAPAFGGVYLMYSRALDGPRLDRARALGRALAAPEAQVRLARELRLLPALRTALADPAVIGDPALAAAAAQATDASGLPPSAALRCAWDAIAAELPPVLLGELAQADAAHDMQASAETCIQK